MSWIGEEDGTGKGSGEKGNRVEERVEKGGDGGRRREGRGTKEDLRGENPGDDRGENGTRRRVGVHRDHD